MTDEELLHLAVQAAQLLAERHAEALHAHETLTFVFGHFRGVRRVSLRLHEPLADRLLVLHADVPLEAEGLPALGDDEAVLLGLDYLDGVLNEHLASEREALPPLDPAPRVFEGRSVFLSGDLRRPDLDAEADALLRAHGEDPTVHGPECDPACGHRAQEPEDPDPSLN